MSDVTVYDLIQESQKKDSVKRQQNKLDILKSKGKKNESVKISSMDEKEIIQLKQQWKELILDTQKLKVEYEKAIEDINKIKELEIDLERGDSWRHKLARWLIK